MDSEKKTQILLKNTFLPNINTSLFNFLIESDDTLRKRVADCIYLNTSFILDSDTIFFNQPDLVNKVKSTRARLEAVFKDVNESQEIIDFAAEETGKLSHIFTDVSLAVKELVKTLIDENNMTI